MALRISFVAFLCLSLTACPRSGGGGGAPDAGSGRCEVDLAATGLFAMGGTGAAAQVISSTDQLIGGQAAHGRLGDVLLQNERVRVVVEQPGRTIGPTLYGGGIVDADLVRPAGEPGADQFGRMALMHALGRVSRVEKVEVLQDGSAGGPAVVAATGVDTEHDLINLDIVVSRQLPGVNFVIDPSVPQPLTMTTYYVLSPGESRVRMLTAFCNTAEKILSFPLIDLIDLRGSMEAYNAGGCSTGLGFDECPIDSSRWVGAQGDGVAYGLRAMSFADLTRPVERNVIIGYGGVVGSMIEGQDQTGLLSWTDVAARTRPGAFGVRPGEPRLYLRDFVVARDLAGVRAVFSALDGAALGTVEVTTAPGARVAVRDATGAFVTVAEATAAGRTSVQLAAGSYQLTAGLPGHELGAPAAATVAAGQTHAMTLPVGAGRTLAVTVKDPFGAPLPAKVTVRCVGACPANLPGPQHFVREKHRGGVLMHGYVPASGQLSMTVPPGEYQVVVTRGPEYSAWPDTWPQAGRAVDLRTADAQLDAVLGRVVDSAGWASADLHVHALNSTDSLVPNEVRVATFLAEGVDVLLSTDHDFITDFAPVIRALGAEGHIASMVGSEVTSFTHGHFNAFPLVRDPASPNGGAFDHAGGEGPTLRGQQLFQGLKAAHPGSVVQLNHPRGGGGVLTLLEVDTATLASHAPPEAFHMAPAPEATAGDTKLFGDGFDLVEVANGETPNLGILNDWMTFLSRGTVRAASGVSDSHTAVSAVGGYSRTWAKVGDDTPAGFAPSAFAEAVRRQQIIAGNGPFLRVTARAVDALDQPTGAAVDVGGTVSVRPADNQGVELVVDVQAPDWFTFDRIDLYTHTSGREATAGRLNDEWPESRVHQKKVLDPLALPVEAVPGTNGVPLRRVHVRERFVVRPTTDTWYVVMVRSTAGGRTMAPLVEDKPWALSNAILVDADGSGAYDDFPLKPGQPLAVARPTSPRVPERRVPTAAEFEAMVRRVLEHGHDEP